MDYGAIPKTARRKDESSDSLCGLSPTPLNVSIVTWLSGVVTLLVTLILFNTTLYSNANVVYIFLAIHGFWSIYAMMTEKYFGDVENLRSVWPRPIGYCCLVALIVGSVSGLYCFDSYGYFSFLYKNSRTYQNTVPSQPAASVADAGRMIFAEEAFVDQTKASGFAAANGYQYCVAPIRDMVKTAHVEFWAVGYDCCGWTGSFACDGATDPEARGGIVVFDNPGIFGTFTTSNRDYYDLARRKAEASYDLNSAKEPLYVRWVSNSDLNMLQKFYEWRTAGFIIFTTTAFAAASAIFVNFGARQYYNTHFGYDA